MPRINRPDDAATLANGGSLADAQQIRKRVYAHETLTPDDMNLVIGGLRKARANPSPEWTNLFSEAMTDYLVHQNEPEDHIPDDKAEWLMSELAKGGGVSSKAEWQMLVDVMNHALSVPPQLSAFALKEIAGAIMSGKRSAFTDEDHPAGVVTKPDVEALRAVLYAATTGSACHITQDEAEVLFDIAHATARGRVDETFNDLFARCIGNYLMAICAHVSTRDQALHRERWLDSRETMPGFFSRVLGDKSKISFFDMLKSPLELADDDMAKLEAQDERALAESEKITDSEADWVMAHLTRQGPLTSAEIRLLRWLNDEAFALPPKLKALAEQAQTPAVETPKAFGHRHPS